MTDTPWVLHKFGGTSVANAERYRSVWKILEEENAPRRAVVVSAMSGVTDALLKLVDLAAGRDESWTEELEELRQRHVQCIEKLLPAASAGAMLAVLDHDVKSLQEILRGIWHSKHAPELNRELVAGHGELWSAQIFDAYLRSEGVDSTWLDARDVLVVDPGERNVAVDFDTSLRNLKHWLTEHAQSTLVVTGFVASTKDGLATTLKRNGSDFSASIFGRLLSASSITIWTDVDGVLTADPRLVPDAVVLDEMSPAEATELAYFGAKVLHPSTMGPAIEANIPIWIRNTFRPERPGTKIHAGAKSVAPVRGFAAIPSVALLNVEGNGMMGVPGVSERLFGALREVGVSVMVISQASSEHSICFVVPNAQEAVAKAAVERAFHAELQRGAIQTVSSIPRCAVLAMVGDTMVHHPGIAGRFFAALGRAGVNVRAIAQGSSERNISIVVDGEDCGKALRVAHSAFYLAAQTISIGLVGCGRVGAAFLEQLAAARERLESESGLSLRVRGIMNSRSMVLSDAAIPLKSWRESLAQSWSKPDLPAFLRHIRAEHLPHAVVIDFTSSDELAREYPMWLAAGLHVITPNKKANSGELALHREIRHAARAGARHFLYETNVGAGLPVLRTLRDLVRTGDNVQKIEGVLSGTLSFLFNTFDGTRPFSALVADAHAAGLTEPDPREDLSGEDVARKLVILAREMGLPIELSSIEVESLVPPELRTGTVDEFLAGLASHDAEWQDRLAAARAKGEVLRYVGSIEAGGKITVSLRSIPEREPLAQLAGRDNVVAFHTDRYRPQPLVVRGPGAGPEVTAAGVFADLLRLSASLGGEP